MRRLIYLLLIVGCSSTEPGLESCPAGDRAWYAELQQAEEQGPAAVSALGLRVAALGCDEIWQSAWIAGRTTMGGEAPADPSDDLTRCLELARAADDAIGVARCGDDLAWVHFLLGDYEASEARYDEALEAARRARRRDLESYIHGNRAALLGELGRFAEAGASLDRAEAGFIELEMRAEAIDVAYNRAIVALELGDAVGAEQVLLRLHDAAERPRDLAELAIALGNVQLALGENDEAAAWFGRVSRDDPELAALADLGRARAALAGDDLDRAREVLTAGLDALGEAYPVRALRLESWLANVERRRGEHAAATARLDRVIAEADASEVAQIGATARWMRGRAALDAGDGERAIADLAASIERLESMRGALDPLDDGLRFLRERADPYVDLLVALARDGGRAERALEVLAGAQANALRRSVPGWDARAPLSIAELRSGLEPGDLLLSYLLGDDHGVLLAVSPAAEHLIEIDGRRAIEPEVRALRAALREDSAYDGALGERLLAPVAQLIDRAERLLVVADRELALLPFSALEWRGRRLVEEVEVATLPLTAPAARSNGERGPLLLAGRPVATREFPPLPWAAFELSEIDRAWPDAERTLLTGEDFTRDALASIGRYRTIHLATHAVASTRDPSRCGVILSGDQRLGVDAIAALELDDPLVVLSACRTGEGELVPGEGVIGLGWAFLRAGAAAIVVSHWTVDDTSTARLMIEFHRRLAAGDDPIEALAAAKRERIAAGEPPSRWAPFEIVVRPR